MIPKIIQILFFFFHFLDLIDHFIFCNLFQALRTFSEKKKEIGLAKNRKLFRFFIELAIAFDRSIPSFPFSPSLVTLHSLAERGTLNRDSLCMTSASELFHTRRHRLRRNAVDLGFDTELQAADSFRRHYHVRRLFNHPVYAFSFCSCRIPQINYRNWKLKFLTVCMRSMYWIIIRSGKLWYYVVFVTIRFLMRWILWSLGACIW